MKNLFNKISEEEKNRILEMHSFQKNVIRESDEEKDAYYDDEETKTTIADKWDERTDTSFFSTFIRKYPSKKTLKSKYKGKDMIEGLENEFPKNFPGEDYLHDFFSDLDDVDW